MRPVSYGHADLGFQSLDRYVRVSPIAFVHHPEAALAQHAVLVPVVSGQHEFVVLDPLHESFFGILAVIVGMLHGHQIAGIALDVAYVQPNSPVQVKIDGQQANE